MLPMTPDDAHLRRTARLLRKAIDDAAWLDWDVYQDARTSIAGAFADFECGIRPGGYRQVAKAWIETYCWWADAIRNAIGDNKAMTVKLLDLVIAEGGQVVHPDRAVSTMPGAMTAAMSPALVAV